VTGACNKNNGQVFRKNHILGFKPLKDMVHHDFNAHLDVVSKKPTTFCCWFFVTISLGSCLLKIKSKQEK
jgi:hypothetical protein